MTRDQVSEQKWASRWRMEYARCSTAESKLAQIEALARAAIDSRGGEWDERAQLYADEVLSLAQGDHA